MPLRFKHNLELQKKKIVSLVGPNETRLKFVSLTQHLFLERQLNL